MLGRADAEAQAVRLHRIRRPDGRGGRAAADVHELPRAGVQLRPQLFGIGARHADDRRHLALAGAGDRRDPARLGPADRHRDDLERNQRAGGRRAAGGVRGSRAGRGARAAQEAKVVPPLLRIRGVSKHFGGFAALSEVSLEVAPGERFGLIGPNGSGKTTLINCVSGALRNESGSIVFDGAEISRLPAYQRTRRGIARSFQIPRPFKTMSVLENLVVPLEYVAHRRTLHTADTWDEAMAILRQMGMAEKADSPSNLLSQVELRKLELARAMAARPRLLISDEAMAGLAGNEKSTLMRCVMGMVRPTRGSVSLDLDGETHDLTRLSTEEIVNLGVAMVPEGRRLFPKLSVEENLLLGAFRKPARADIGRNLAFSFEIFPVLAERRRQLAGSLSGGQQQMLAISRALMSSPRLLLVDEPSVGLAPILVSHTITKIRELKQRYGLTVLMAEQNFHQAIRIADRGYIIVHGEIVFDGRTVAELEQNPLVKNYYLGSAA